MKGKNAGGDAEERVPTQHFHIPVLEVKGVVRNYGRGVDERFIVINVRKRAGRRPIVRGTLGREVGETGNANGRRVGG